MTGPVRVAITFRVDDEIVRAIEAVDPRVQVVDFPQIQLRPGVALSDEEMAQAKAALADVEVIFGPNTLPPPLVEAAAKLKWFQVITAGVDRMVQDGLLGRQFVVTKVSGLAAPAIAEYVLATMLMLTKGLHTSVRDQQEHRWSFRFTAELRGKTCGVVGLGAIGREIAKRARAFGMRVVASRRRCAPGETDPDCDALYSHSELSRVLAESDFVVLCVPLTEETRGMIGATEIGQMKPTASLVNIARGAVVDQEALIAALQNGTIAGAALDVVEPEPLPADCPLWDMANVILTPHISGAVEGYGHRAAQIFLANLGRYVRGEPLANLVDPVLAY
jgi:phosphoglycerate dehydrogenase-like enzyme